jgi:hypothetical protein
MNQSKEKATRGAPSGRRHGGSALARDPALWVWICVVLLALLPYVR